MGKLTWTDNEDDEMWMHSLYDTVQECIEDAVENYEYKTGDTIAVGECVPVEINVDVDAILENLEEQVYEEVGEVSEEWDISSHFGNGEREQAFKKLQEAVDKAVMKYIKEIHEVPNFYTVQNIRRIVITESK